MSITRLVCLDVYRDGGSISCAYEIGNFNGNHTLFFGIKNGPVFDRSIKYKVYSDPELQITENTIYTCPMTGTQIPDCKRTSRSISWDEARGILKEIEPMIHGFTSDYLWVYNDMTNAANGNGDTRAMP